MQPTNKPLLTSTCTDITMLSIGALLYASCSSGNGLNEMCSSLFKNHIFDMKSYYKALSGGLREVFPWQVIFKTKGPFGNVVLITLFKCCGNTCGCKNVL